MNKINKFLATLLLLMFMSLASQVNAQETTTWTVTPRFERIVAPVPRGTAPVISTETTIVRNTDTDLHIGVFFEIEGEIIDVDAYLTERARALDPDAPMAFARFSNGSPGLASFGFTVLFNESGGLSEEAVKAWVADIWLSEKNPTTPSLFSQGIRISAKNIFLSESGFLAAFTNEVVIDRFLGKAACGTQLVPVAGCDLFIGSFSFDLDEFPADLTGAMEISFGNSFYNLTSIDKRAGAVLNLVEPTSITQTVCSTTAGCPLL